MTPDRRKLLNECLSPGESELYHTTITAFTGSKEDIEWLKAFRNGELKKRTAYQRRTLIEDARMQIEKWEAKAKRDAETPVTCPKCQTPNFLPAGLRAHLPKCKGINRSTALAIPGKAKPKAIDGKAEIVGDLDLSAIRSALEAERDTVIKHEEEFKDATLPRFLRMGLQCLKAQQCFAMSTTERASAGGKAKAALSPGDKAEGDSTEEPAEPDSFSGWLSTAVPWLNKASAYKYLRATEGLGLTHESTEKDLDKSIAAARKSLGEGKKLSLTLLANKAGKIEIEESENPNTPESRAAEAREQVHTWITNWDRSVKAGNLEDADTATLKQLEEFLTNTREHVRKRLKSSSSLKTEH